MQRKLLLVALIALMVPAIFAEELNYSGSLSVTMETNSFQPGETINAEIRAVNNEPFPITDSYLVVELVKGGEFYYPPQSFNTDNVFFEETIPGISIPANAYRTVNFSYPIPEDIGAGSYRLDAYFRNRKTYISGIPHLFASPTSALFEISGNGQFPHAKILRAQTAFEGITGMEAFEANAGQEFRGSIFIENTSQESLEGLQVFVGLCEWDDTGCGSYEPKATIPIESLGPGEQKEIEASMPAPMDPDAYAIRIELRDSSGKMLSMFRNRAIVTGETRKIKKIYPDNYYYTTGSTVKLHSYVGPSPDHFTNPVLEGASLNVSIKDIQNNDIVFQDSAPLAEEWQSNDFSFIAPRELSEFEVCASVTKGSMVYDEYCYGMIAASFALDELSQVSVSWHYSPLERKLGLKICSASEEGFPASLNAGYVLREGMTNSIVDLGSVTGKGCAQREIMDIHNGEYGLSVVNRFTGEKISETIIALSAVECHTQCNDSNPCTIDSCTQDGCKTVPAQDGMACGENASCMNGVCMQEPDTMGTTLIIIAVIILAGMAYIIYRRKKK